jgi:hypothetical protein
MLKHFLVKLIPQDEAFRAGEVVAGGFGLSNATSRGRGRKSTSSEEWCQQPEQEETTVLVKISD